MVPQTLHCGLKSYDFIFSFFDLITFIKQCKKKRSRDIFWRYKLVLRDSTPLEISFLFSFSFRRSICLICNLNSEGNLTRKHLNLELYPEGGFQVLFYKFIQIQTAISKLIYEIFQNKIQLSTPFFRSFRKKKLGDSKI